ncbi:MAG: histidine phosphatase family protein [Candidatus Nanohaloarchaea archaeon]
MTTILLCRHGETDHNRSGVIQGRTDVPLNRTGMEQAEHLADRLADRDIDAIYTSSLQRAARTADIIADRHDADAVRRDSLREMALGDLEGSDWTEWYAEIREQGSDLHDWAPADGESLREAEQRFRETLEEFSAAHPDETVVVVAHGGIIRAIILGVLDARRDRYYNIAQDNGCLNVLRYDDEIGWIVDTLNDTCHIDLRED